jgi:hypothetical protein
MPDFANVGVFLVFVFVLFATMGLHQYNGDYYNACRFSDKPFDNGTWPIDQEYKRVCSKTGLGNF